MPAYFGNAAAFSSAYRPDIDGLRAIAVLGVLFFHAGIPWLPGGFVGVDIFFVISGYLITGILIKDIEQGDYSIARFYVRRARRILPALVVMLLVSGGLAWFFLLPGELKQYAHHMEGSLLFISNIFFWRESGYFDVVAEFKPLLHTWSLAVEEQFYMLWPLMLLLASKQAFPLRGMFLVLLAASFFWASYSVLRHPSNTFFLIQSRAWELLLGAALVLFPAFGRTPMAVRQMFSLLGLTAIIFSYLFLSKDSVFPAWNALWPCFGAALLIAAGPEAFVNKGVLAWRPIVFIGLISYSLYLWHWPLLAFLRITHLGNLPVSETVLTLLISLLLAILSWRFVETPFRHMTLSVNPLKILSHYSLVLLLLLAATLVVKNNNGFPDRMPQSVLDAQAAAENVNLARSDCHLGLEQFKLPFSSKCVTGNSENLRVLVWGDSHAEALLPGVAGSPFFSGRGVRQMTKTSCPPLVGVDVVRGHAAYTECTAFNESVVSWLRSETASSIDTVILAARWPVYFYESGFGLPEEISRVPKHALMEHGSRRSGRDALLLAIAQTIRSIQATGKRVVLVGTIPEMRVDVPSCVARKRLAGDDEEGCGITLEQLASRIMQPDISLQNLARDLSVEAVFPASVLCPGGKCRVVNPAGVLLYYDHNHLSASGATWIAKSLFPGEAR